LVYTWFVCFFSHIPAHNCGRAANIAITAFANRELAVNTT
jgi:hypothetical protein